MKKFEIVSSKMYDFYTKYIIKHNNKLYICNYNGGLPKLQGKTLTESQSYYLSETIEDYFLSYIK